MWKRLAAFLLLMIPAIALSANTVTLSAQATSGNGSAIPVLTWSASAGATSCTAGGGWSGTKAVSGTETLPAITASSNFTLTCQWPADTTAVLSWTAPTKNQDGSSYTNPGGYKVFWGLSSTSLTNSKNLADPARLTYTITGLTPATWYFAVSAYNAIVPPGESVKSATVSKVVTGSQSAVQGISITINPLPMAPTSLTVN